MKNIHILPTDKTSRLQSNRYSKLFLSEVPKAYADCINQNIYITSDGEIKEGDWYLTNKNTLCKCIKTDSKYVYSLEGGSNTNCKKIILTTDQDLIEDGVQAIDNEFLEWFVKNPSCEWVEIEKMFNVVQFTSREFIYKIIIPKEEPKPHSFCETPEEKCTMNYCDENGCQNRKRELVEPKQETLEEVAERYYEDEVSINAFINGYKLAQEQILDFLYSEITERRDYSASKMCEKVIEFTKNK